MIFAVATVLAALSGALAAPRPQLDPNHYENIDIADLFVRKLPEDSSITGVSFLLSGKNATNLACSAENPVLPSPVITCGDSKYRFALYPGDTTEFALAIYHELGTAFGFSGKGDVFTYCHAGGMGALACTQQNPTTIVIDAEPRP